MSYADDYSYRFAVDKARRYGDSYDPQQMVLDDQEDEKPESEYTTCQHCDADVKCLDEVCWFCGEIL